MGKLSKFQKFVRASIAETDFVALYKSTGKRKVKKETERDDSPVRPTKKGKGKKTEAARPKKVSAAKGKKKKDPAAPKGAISAAFAFMNHPVNKEACKKALGEEFKADTGREWISKRWAALTTEERQPWIDVQRAEEARYKRQMEEFKKTGKYTEEARTPVKLPVSKKPAPVAADSSEEDDEDDAGAGSYSQHDSSSE